MTDLEKIKEMYFNQGIRYTMFKIDGQSYDVLLSVRKRSSTIDYKFNNGRLVGQESYSENYYE